ncbi:hypothetical protein PsYK624_163110 [Phanerochaete sordida]|uniref:Uncharacterized protein n=1 Tax=Phanerochaete sordida TaxID=48140 RepID=A0A9P3LLR9_9APHY|nr:hypothetical protein PsYK624_163110 [Phanerochaete sordida]
MPATNIEQTRTTAPPAQPASNGPVVSATEASGIPLNVDNPATLVHAVTKSKTKVEREAAKGQKTGAPGNFRGAPGLYLSGFWAWYVELMEMERGKKKALDGFWYTVRIGLWLRFT